jgi:hypothetical protein
VLLPNLRFASTSFRILLKTSSRCNLFVIYAILFAMSVVSAFFVPAQSVAVRTLVPMAGLMAVNGLMSQAQQGRTRRRQKISATFGDYSTTIVVRIRIDVLREKF